MKKMDDVDEDLSARRSKWLPLTNRRVQELDRALALERAIDLGPVNLVTQSGFQDILLPTAVPEWYPPSFYRINRCILQEADVVRAAIVKEAVFVVNLTLFFPSLCFPEK